jgi:DNA invertase Pin-like site-specific DNA recombinase
MSKLLRAALYIRVSHEEQVLHGYSLEAQRQSLTEYAQKNNLHIFDYYIDEGQTARKTYNKRKDFIRMLEDVKAGNLDIILFIKLDRWFRNVRDYYKIQDILEKHNVNWRTIYENYDTSTANGRLHINIMLSVAQDEADRTSERIKFVFENKIRNGEVITGNMAFGYRIENKKLVIEPKEAEIVKDVFDYYLHRQSKYAAITYIKEKYGVTLYHNALSRMLIKKIYLGEYRNVINYCDAIIDRDTFVSVQEIIKSNIRMGKTRVIYVYSGLLRCPLCGRNLASAKTKTSEHVYNIHYRCNGRYQDKTCTFNHSIGEKKIDAFLLANIEQQIKSYIADYEMKSKSTPKPRIAEYEKLRSRLEKLKDLYLDDLINKDTYKRDYEELTAKIHEINDKRTSPPKVDISALQSFLNKDLNRIYADLTRPEKQTLWRSIIKEIHFDAKTLRPKIFFA